METNPTDFEAETEGIINRNGIEEQKMHRRLKNDGLKWFAGSESPTTNQKIY